METTLEPEHQQAPDHGARLSAAPIALFAYNRPQHLRLTVEALQKNTLAGVSDLYVFCDGPRNVAADAHVAAVRAFTRTVNGFGSVTLIDRETNFGLARNIIDGVSNICTHRGRVIVLEDDIVTSPVFLQYMNDGLNFYEHEPRIGSIHGYCYPAEVRLPETFFLRGADCWGWATWRHAWRFFEPDGTKLLRELRESGLASDFDLGGAFGYTAMLIDQIAGRNDSWAVRWHASCFLKNLLTLYPGRSLVQNIGNDATGVHCGSSDKYLTDMATDRVRVGGIEVAVSEQGRREVAAFLRNAGANPLASKLARLWRRVGFTK